MQSLLDLNSHSRTIIEVADTRASGVVLDRLVSAVADQIVVASTSITVKVGAEIVEVVNYATANVRYRLTINRPSPSLPSTSLSWATIPSGLTLTTAGYVYTISGIKTPAEWNIVKNPIWTVPADFASYPIWYITAEIIYYDSAIGADVSVSWDVFDDEFFYVADLEASSTLTAVVGKRQIVNVALSLTATFAVLPNIFVTGRFTFTCTPTKLKGLQATLPALTSIITTATTDFMSVQYTVTASETISITLAGVSSVIVYWGDNTSNTYTASGTVTHGYATSGNKKVTVVGTFTGFTNNSTSLKRVFSFPTSNLTKLGGLGTKLLEIPATLPTSVRDLSNCFSAFTGTADSNQFDLSTISSWDVSRVTNMSYMFHNNRAFNSSINGWNVGLVVNMEYMFYRGIFNQSLSSWNTQSVQKFDFMFAGEGGDTHPFNQNISTWNVGNATTMLAMFQNSVFNQAINTWNVGNVTNMSFMFEFNLAFNQPLYLWNTINVLYFDSMFRNSNFNQAINTWNTSNAISMTFMFSGGSASGGFKTTFNQPLSAWNVIKVRNMQGMFRNSVFNQAINTWNTSGVLGSPTNGMRNMFQFNTAFDQNISGWCVSNHPTKPTNFDTDTNASWTTGEKPQWGTCP